MAPSSRGDSGRSNLLRLPYPLSLADDNAPVERSSSGQGLNPLLFSLPQSSPSVARSNSAGGFSATTSSLTTPSRASPNSSNGSAQLQQLFSLAPSPHPPTNFVNAASLQRSLPHGTTLNEFISRLTGGGALSSSSGPERRQQPARKNSLDHQQFRPLNDDVIRTLRADQVVRSTSLRQPTTYVEASLYELHSAMKKSENNPGVSLAKAESTERGRGEVYRRPESSDRRLFAPLRRDYEEKGVNVDSINDREGSRDTGPVADGSLEIAMSTGMSGASAHIQKIVQFTPSMKVTSSALQPGVSLSASNHTAAVSAGSMMAPPSSAMGPPSVPPPIIAPPPSYPPPSYHTSAMLRAAAAATAQNIIDATNAEMLPTSQLVTRVAVGGTPNGYSGVGSSQVVGPLHSTPLPHRVVVPHSYDHYNPSTSFQNTVTPINHLQSFQNPQFYESQLAFSNNNNMGVMEMSAQQRYEMSMYPGLETGVQYSVGRMPGVQDTTQYNTRGHNGLQEYSLVDSMTFDAGRFHTATDDTRGESVNVAGIGRHLMEYRDAELIRNNNNYIAGAVQRAASSSATQRPSAQQALDGSPVMRRLSIAATATNGGGDLTFITRPAPPDYNQHHALTAGSNKFQQPSRLAGSIKQQQQLRPHFIPPPAEKNRMQTNDIKQLFEQFTPDELLFIRRRLLGATVATSSERGHYFDDPTTGALNGTSSTNGRFYESSSGAMTDSYAAAQLQRQQQEQLRAQQEEEMDSLIRQLSEGFSVHPGGAQDGVVIGDRGGHSSATVQQLPVIRNGSGASTYVGGRGGTLYSVAQLPSNLIGFNSTDMSQQVI